MWGKAEAWGWIAVQQQERVLGIVREGLGFREWGGAGAGLQSGPFSAVPSGTTPMRLCPPLLADDLAGTGVRGRVTNGA